MNAEKLNGFSVEGRPEKVELPAALGGGFVDVRGHFFAPPPNDKDADDVVRHLVLSNCLNVAECDNGLVWYARGVADAG